MICGVFENKEITAKSYVLLIVWQEGELNARVALNLQSVNDIEAIKSYSLFGNRGEKGAL